MSIPDNTFGRPGGPATLPDRNSVAAPQGAGFSIDGFLACLLVTAGGLGATAAVGGLRVPDLAISGLVMAGTIVLAMRDSRHLTAAILASWMFAPMVRRMVDWHLGGYTSLTALSLLPIMATSALIVPLYPRLRAMPRGLTEPLLLTVVPVLLMSGVGLARYGPGAVVEAGAWLMPALFFPYLATRPMGEAERSQVLRAAVLLAAVAAVYGIYQFLVLPMWDRVWLVESGMTSSMGSPLPQEIRVWGPLNSAGTAGAVWSVALLTAFADRRWRPVVRFPAIAVMLVALCLTFVRIGWLMATVGIVAQSAFGGRRGGASVAVTAVVALAVLLLALPYLPQGDRIARRFVTLSDLKHDDSYNVRAATTADLAEQILRTPLGLGLGYKTKSKLEGASNNIVPVDNGYADLFVTLGWVGGGAYLLGFSRIFARCWRVTKAPAAREWGWLIDLSALSCACIVLVTMSTFAAFAMVGLMAAWVWCCVGLASSPAVEVSPDDPARRPTVRT